MKNTNKVLGLIAIIAVIALNVLLMIGCSDGDDSSSSPIYIITKTDGGYAVSKDGTTVGTAEKIQTAIESIRSAAEGGNVTIQFGDGTDVLDIGSSYITFSNTDSKWGEITLTGKITANSSTSSNATINISNPVSVTSSADIANTSTYYTATTFSSSSTGAVNITGGTLYNKAGFTVQNYSSGTLTISGGTINSDSGWPVYNSSSGGGTIAISGGTVSSKSSAAVYNSGNGKIIVSGSADITSANTSAVSGTIYISTTSTGVTIDTVSLEMTGGTVTNTSETNGNAIFNGNIGKINITGGKVSKAGTTGNAIYSIGVVTIGSGATIEGKTFGVTP